jgi:hypothetical protein
MEVKSENQEGCGGPGRKFFTKTKETKEEYAMSEQLTGDAAVRAQVNGVPVYEFDHVGLMSSTGVPSIASSAST